MPEMTLEERVAVLENEIEQIRRDVRCKHENSLPWWELRFGAFEGSEEYEEAMKLGREYRESLRPASDRVSASVLWT